MVPAKATYMNKDVDRLAQYFQIPLKSPTVIFKSQSSSHIKN